ncbi:MAG TPA: metalloregulator ArsR/SmtB family transcription factor [Pseudomonadota bacterium]|nr:metalloregulator ArsR/SmtB family transcription factor [Rhodanobacteraceae bacterium]MBP9153899.1 metalloregulator ArsR/SmtB family transcription factor [Xanthomonadales bacterium]HQW81139.1 metalloregulator ArsR/SmtB family transcription factor [Pseudomonadota bacterium]
MDLTDLSSLFRTLSDATRVRLLVLLEAEELTVAELASITQLAQPRVSTHLAKLKELDLVRDRRAGVSAYYRFNGELDDKHALLWRTMRHGIDDALLDDDARRLPTVLATRAKSEGWADTVAGDMERHYSPGRTWEALARGAMHLVELGDVLDVASGDGVLAELLAPHAKSILCVDSNERTISAARDRLRPLKQVRVEHGDMHALALADAKFDLVLLMHALTYSEQPALAVREAARVLRPGGRLLALTLNRHAHKAVAEEFDHCNLGFTVDELKKLAKKAGLDVIDCEVSSREKRAPNFEVLTLLARKP